MTTPTLAQIREGLATTIKAGIERTDLAVYHLVEDLAQAPAVCIEPEDADFFGAMNDGMHTWDFSVYLIVSRADPTSAQAELDEFISGYGPNSIHAALIANETLGIDGVYDASVVRVTNYGFAFKLFNTPHVGALLKVRVRTHG